MSCSSDSGGARADQLRRVKRVAIHPAIGIARVGNSTDAFYLAPEIPGTIPRPSAGFKDASGAIPRQATRFRLYGLDDSGAVVTELSAADGAITWSVTVANKKAAWYDFDVAFDVPVAQPTGRRNPDIKPGKDRDALVIAPGAKKLVVPRTGGTPPGTPVLDLQALERSAVALDGGTFQGEPVNLGELLADGRGRLLFMPAHGKGFSPTSAPLTTYSDNNGWADDVCDGPVTATIDLDGRTLSAEPAWVIVTPPNYGPAMAAGLVSAYDSARMGWGDASRPRDVRFTRDILPIFARIVDMQWVNAGFLRSNGWNTPGDYLSPSAIDRLADGSKANADYRTSVFEQFRNPDYKTEDATGTPQMYGDGVAIPAKNTYQWLAVTPIQYEDLRRWAAGDAVDDRAGAAATPAGTDVDPLPLAEQPAALDRAGLESCLGGAYHPGIEVPWSLRVPSMWSAPYRLKVRSRTMENTDYGDQLTAEKALAPGGPVDGSGPGDLTRWQGVPWQSDAASCRSGYEPDISTVLPTFWPARVPNHVLREADYKIVVDTSKPMADRKAAFARRFDWERFVAGANREDTLNNMMDGWFKLGVITEQPGPSDGAFPAVMKVESLVGFSSEPAVAYGPDYEPEAEPVEP